ncbi:hypothetical protein GALMADRAFT_251027 [Galerina marginata CBS 339.88]|uniref:Uncharacterized protein n=1 Tax=Galerina marginata (strain CBS 339.88) TaxID=685588 RepID=A0A067ST68_GALM3|nr:hypothetical protein GALMADRAFT_251027 [Galerina marginata CBS 339.88]
MSDRPIQLRTCGPSVYILDSAFGVFDSILRSDRSQHAPDDDDYIHCQWVAHKLNASMRDIYDHPLHPTVISTRRHRNSFFPSSFLPNHRTLSPLPIYPGTRGAAALRALQGFLPSNCFHNVFSGDNESTFDVLFSDEIGQYFALRVYDETSDQGEPYMELGSLYDLLCRKQLKPVLPGCPMFLVSIAGPAIIIYGAFHDGVSILIEPLFLHISHCAPLVEPWKPLGQALYALRSAILDLQSRSHNPLPPVTIIPGCPVLFTNFVLENPVETVELKLEYIRPFELPGLDITHIFEANSATKCKTEGKAGDASILVKFPVGSAYGRHVHEKLASLGLAPRLLGLCSTPIGTAYAMEFLRPPTDCEGGWISLEELAHSLPSTATEYASSIRNKLDEIVKAFEDNGFVHGDLRPNNLMIRMKNFRLVDVDADGSPRLMVIDFDWANNEPYAVYPPLLNMSIPWPGKPGKRILMGHDRIMVDTWAGPYPAPSLC